MAEQQLLAVLEYFGLPEPGYGERAFRCPAHEDTHPSASINRQKGLWHCHACGAGGGVIALVQALDGGSYQDACRVLENVSTGLISPPRGTSRRTKGRRWIPPRLRGA